MTPFLIVAATPSDADCLIRLQKQTLPGASTFPFEEAYWFLAVSRENENHATLPLVTPECGEYGGVQCQKASKRAEHSFARHPS